MPQESTTEENFIISEEQHIGLRVDVFLSKNSSISSRSQVEKLIASQFVSVNGKHVKSSFRLSKDDHVTMTSINKESFNGELGGFDYPLNRVYEDDDVLVINKPSGLVVHPSVGHEQDTLVNALVHSKTPLAKGSHELRPGIVHRLDKDTSGLLVVAKSEASYESLTQQFQERSIQRHYWCIVYGVPRSEAYTIESLLARHPKHRKKFASTDNRELGKNAISHFKICATRSGLSLLKVKLETGRTHQIRVHTSENGFPIVGDLLYSADRRRRTLKSVRLRKVIADMNRFALHAAELGFTHPITGEKLFFNSSWPDNLLPLVEYCKFEGIIETSKELL